jgi:sulfate transport system permease protein
MLARWSLRTVAVGYIALLLLVPVGLVLWRTFENGVPPVLAVLGNGDFQHALWMTCLIALIAVPLNTVFGVLCAIVLVRQRFHGVALLSAFVDLPLGVSPVVVGLALIVVYGRFGWWGGWLLDHNVQVIFAFPGTVLATIFISLPFVVREVVPVLREIGAEQEQAAATLGATGWQTFWRITLPAVRSGVGYGIVLTTARALGEFGAVSIVSGNLIGQTETLTLFVQNKYEAFDSTSAYTASVVLAMLALVTLFAMNLFKPAKDA